MNEDFGLPTIATVEDLYAVAYQIEVDAAERYAMLTGQMEVHNNAELAELFRDLARAEWLHASVIAKHAGSEAIAADAQRIGRWARGESPEAADLQAVHYLMTPREALLMALAGEERAVAFFKRVVDTAASPALKELALDLLEEEVAHVNLCHRLLQRHPARAGAAPVDDMDPPRAQD
jgi:rubrerythrin